MVFVFKPFFPLRLSILSAIIFISYFSDQIFAFLLFLGEENGLSEKEDKNKNGGVNRCALCIFLFKVSAISPGRYQELDLFIKVLRLLCPNLTDASFVF